MLLVILEQLQNSTPWISVVGGLRIGHLRDKLSLLLCYLVPFNPMRNGCALTSSALLAPSHFKASATINLAMKSQTSSERFNPVLMPFNLPRKDVGKHFVGCISMEQRGTIQKFVGDDAKGPLNNVSMQQQLVGSPTQSTMASSPLIPRILSGVR